MINPTERLRFESEFLAIVGRWATLHAVKPRQSRKDVQRQLERIERSAATLLQALVGLRHVEGQDPTATPFHHRTVQALASGYITFFKPGRPPSYPPPEAYPTALIAQIGDLRGAATEALRFYRVGRGNNVYRTRQSELVSEVGTLLARLHYRAFGKAPSVSATCWQVEVFARALASMGIELEDVPAALKRALRDDAHERRLKAEGEKAALAESRASNRKRSAL